MTEPNYKELCEEFYNAFKQTFGNKTERQVAILEKYENLHKPKMKRCLVAGSGVVEFVEYDKQQYALFWNNWYLLDSGKLYHARGISEELNQAYEEYKNQPKYKYK